MKLLLNHGFPATYYEGEDLETTELLFVSGRTPILVTSYEDSCFNDVTNWATAVILIDFPQTMATYNLCASMWSELSHKRVTSLLH